MGFGMVSRGYVINVGRGYVIQNSHWVSQSVSNEGGYRAARAAKKSIQRENITRIAKLTYGQRKALWKRDFIVGKVHMAKYLSKLSVLVCLGLLCLHWSSMVCIGLLWSAMVCLSVSIHFHTFIHFPPLSSTFIRIHPLLSIFINFIHFHPLSSKGVCLGLFQITIQRFWTLKPIISETGLGWVVSLWMLFC